MKKNAKTKKPIEQHVGGGMYVPVPAGMTCPLGCGMPFHVFSRTLSPDSTVSCPGFSYKEAAIYLQTERLIKALGRKR